MSQLHAERIIGLIGCSGDHRNKAVRVTPPQCDDTPGYGSVWMHGGIPTDPFSWISVFRQHLQGSISHTWNFWICDSIWFDSRSKEFEIKTFFKSRKFNEEPSVPDYESGTVSQKVQGSPLCYCTIIWNVQKVEMETVLDFYFSALSMVHRSHDLNIHISSHDR